MAVHEPRPGIVSLEGDDDEAVSGHQHHISPWRIDSVQADVFGGVDGVFGLLEDSKVVPVEVDLRSKVLMLEKGTMMERMKRRLTGCASESSVLSESEVIASHTCEGLVTVG